MQNTTFICYLLEPLSFYLQNTFIPMYIDSSQAREVYMYMFNIAVVTD